MLFFLFDDNNILTFGGCVCFCVVKYVNPITNVCIIRTSREDYQNVWAAITMVRSIGNYPVVFNMLDLSGESKYCIIGTLCFCFYFG